MTTAPSPDTTAEHARLAEATGLTEDKLLEANPWYEWGPYLSERACLFVDLDAWRWHMFCIDEIADEVA